jgi:hypothetical protein
MKRNTVKVTALAVGLFIFESCVTTTVIQLAPEERKKIEGAEKVWVQKTDGSEIELTQPMLMDQKICGRTKDKKNIEIGFASIHRVEIRKTDYRGLYIGTMVVAVTAALAIGAATAPKPPPSSSCPFIYSCSGGKEVLDAEPYGGSICRGLKRTEWCVLEHLAETDGRYHIRIANKLREDQYTDELKLVVVDHPAGVRVAPDTLGSVHAFVNPVPPARALDRSGSNVAAAFVENDAFVWEAPYPDADSAGRGALRESLVFEFPKPKDAKRAKLLVNGSTTPWGSQVARDFLGLYGTRLPAWYAAVDAPGFARDQVLSWYRREGLYLLPIQVETDKGWIVRAVLFGGGPFASEDKATVLDIGDVPGDTLRIRLEPAVQFWSINQVAVDYTDDAPLKVDEVEAVEARGNGKTDVRDLLARNDDRYFVLNEMDESADVFFPSPPKTVGLERTVILKASGYYRIRLEPTGEARADTLMRILTEPGYTLDFAFARYRRAVANSLTLNR